MAKGKKSAKSSKDKKTETHISSASEEIHDKQVNGTSTVTEEDLTNDEKRIGDGDGKYAKRKIESNWSRYDQLEVDENLEEDDEYEETKDFEFIKLNACTSVSSHFKFKEEKEWENELCDTSNKGNGNTFGLDLTLLGVEIGKHDILDKLELKTLITEECKYCIRDLHKSTIDANEFNSYTQTAGNLINAPWSYKGLQNYMPLIGGVHWKNNNHNYLPNTDNMSNLVINEATTDELNPNDNSSVANNECNDTNIELNANTVAEKDFSSLQANSNGDIDILNDLLADDTVAVSSVNNLDITNENVNENEIKNSLISEINGELIENNKEEMDLDMLLEVESATTVADVKHEGKKEADCDLDQWLDNMIT